MNKAYSLLLLKSIHFLLISFLIFLTSFKTNIEESNVKIFNIAEALEQNQEVFLSRFVDAISYVPLESKPDLILGQTSKIEVTNEYIFVKNTGFGVSPQILLFDRKTGKFIREIGKQGSGPSEYQDISSIPFSHSRYEIYAIG